MTVGELFDKFSRYFSQIGYTNKSTDTEGMFIDKADFVDAKNEEFIERFGERYVDDWTYDAFANTIYVEFC